MSQGQIIRHWWGEYLGDRDSGAAKGLAARLRRADPLQVLCEPAVHVLASRLDTREPERLTRLVRVLAELRGDNKDRLAKRLGGPEPVLSLMRFQRLMRSDSEALTTALVRAVHYLKTESRSCSIAALGSDLWFWDDRTRAKWTFDYFAAPQPESLEQSSSERTNS